MNAPEPVEQGIKKAVLHVLRRLRLVRRRPSLEDYLRRMPWHRQGLSASAKKHIRHEWWECLRKLRHEDSLSAMYHAIRLNRDYPEAVIGIYVCDYCYGVHVGRTKRARSKYLPDDWLDGEIALDKRPDQC